MFPCSVLGVKPLPFLFGGDNAMREELSYEFTGHSGSKLYIQEVFIQGPDEKRVEITTSDDKFGCFVEDLPVIAGRLLDIYCASLGYRQ